MSKDIWYTTKEKPMLHRDIILCGNGWSMPIDTMPETVNNICWKNVEKWCYLEDLIKENERTRKALDNTIGRLKLVEQQLKNVSALGETAVFLSGVMSVVQQILSELEQITALEQKE